MTKKGYKQTEEHKENLSKSHKGKISKNFELFKKAQEKYLEESCSKGFLGKHHSEETKRIIGEKGKGRMHTEEWKSNMKERFSKEKNPFYNKKHTQETIEKNRIAHTGERNVNWLGGKSTYGKGFNKLFKQAIVLRDYSCVLCGSDKSLCIHHIDYNRLNSIKENCIALCRSCHCKTNYNRNQWKLFFQSYLNEKYGYEINDRIEELKRTIRKQSIEPV